MYFDHDLLVLIHLIEERKMSIEGIKSLFIVASDCIVNLLEIFEWSEDAVNLPDEKLSTVIQLSHYFLLNLSELGIYFVY